MKTNTKTKVALVEALREAGSTLGLSGGHLEIYGMLRTLEDSREILEVLKERPLTVKEREELEMLLGYHDQFIAYGWSETNIWVELFLEAAKTLHELAIDFRRRAIVVMPTGYARLAA